MIWLWLAAAFAQEPVPAGGPPSAQAASMYEIPNVPPGPPPPSEQVQALAYQIGAKMRCPVCQGMAVADSTSTAAVQMQQRIRELVAAGYDEDQIRAFFVQRYGEWILLNPEPTGWNLALRVLPVAALGLGLALAASVVLRWRKEPDDVPLPSDLGLVPKDPYEQRLLAELED